MAPYLALIGAMTLAILSPGPAIISAIQTAFSRGREVAMPYGMGLAFGASLWGAFALAGLAVVFALHPELYRGVKLLGGLYLLWMAQGLWRAATQPLPDAAEKRFGRGFFGGVLLNLSNPKPALFYSALLLSLFPGPLTLGRQASIYATALTTELFWYAAVVTAMSTVAMRRRYFDAKFWIDRIASVALGLLGLALIFNN
ncbi:LysE family translocator [Paracoccus jeotgali]|nr:LysE family transporter [Paracoccus jeotgali]